MFCGISDRTSEKNSRHSLVVLKVSVKQAKYSHKQHGVVLDNDFLRNTYKVGATV